MSISDFRICGCWLDTEDGKPHYCTARMKTDTTNKGSLKGESQPPEKKCPRCGDMFYHPKAMLQDASQRAQEWEEIAKQAEAKLKEAEEEMGRLREALRFLSTSGHLHAVEVAIVRDALKEKP